MMTVRDLLKMNVDIDVLDDATEELYIAFCGPQKLTEEGEKHFADVLEYQVKLSRFNGSPLAIICVDDDDDAVWKPRLKKAKEFFYGMAGYCSCEDYDHWFAEEDDDE